MKGEVTLLEKQSWFRIWMEYLRSGCCGGMYGFTNMLLYADKDVCVLQRCMVRKECGGRFYGY